MISNLIGGRELFQTGKNAKEGDVLYIDRSIKAPDGGWTRVTKVVLSAPVASDTYTRSPLFDYSTCQVSAGW